MSTKIISVKDLVNWLRELRIVSIEGYDEDGNDYFAIIDLGDEE